MATYNVGNIEIGAVANTSSALNSLDKLISKLDQIKNKNTSTYTTNVKNNDKINEQARNVDKLNSRTKKVDSSFKGISKTLSGMKGQLSSMFNLGKIYFLINYAKRAINSIVRVVSVASDYNEILNKFQVSFGNLNEESLDYVNKLSKAYGLSSNTLMNYTSTFNNMLKSLRGLTDETSKRLSFTLTQMALDYSSLFNQSIESTMLAFQSMLSGQIRPIRSVSGIDTSETSIFAVYKELGGTKTMRQLSQLEKRLLRIIAVQQQMTKAGAIGDMGRTIENFANQVRIMKEEFIEFSATWGQLILVYLKPVIQYINGILIALNAIGQSIKKNNEETQNIDYGKEFAGLKDNALDAEEAVDELNKSVNQLGLDQLNVLGGSSSSNNFDIGVDQKILDAVKEYEANLDNVNFKAKQIADNILSWFGFTKDENGEIIILSGKIGYIKDIISSFSGDLKSVFEGIRPLIGELIAYLTPSAKMFFDSILTEIKSISSLVIEIAKPLMNLIMPIAKFLIESVAKIVNFISQIIDLLTPIINTLLVTLEPIITSLLTYISGFIDKAMKKSSEWINTLKGFWTLFFEPVIENIMVFINDVFDILAVIYDSIVVPINEMLGDIIVYTILPALGTIMNLITSIVGLVMAIIKPIVQILAPIIKGIMGMVQDIVSFLSKLLGGIVTFINVIVSGLGGLINLLIEGVNWIIRQLNKIHVKAPDWLGGWEFGFNIQELSKLKLPSFPQLATGNVATTPTLAEFGEYANARYNPEITAPQSILKETFMESMLPFVNAILKSNDEVVKAINDKDLEVSINGRKFAESTINDFRAVAIRKGIKI